MTAIDHWFSIDFETSSQNRYSCKIDRICVARFSMETGRADQLWDFSFRPGLHLDVAKVTPTSHVDLRLMDLMSLPHPKVAHNAGFELWLMEQRLGIKMNGPLHDTYQMAKHWRNDLPAYDLKSLSWWVFGDLYHPLTRLRQWIHKANLEGEDDIEFDMTKCPDKLVHDYCYHDVRMTARLASFFYPNVKDNYAYQQDTAVIPLNTKMEGKGITADVEFYKRFIKLGNRRIGRNVKQASNALDIEDGRKPTGKALREHLGKRGETRKTPTQMVKSDDVVLRDHTDSEAVRAVQRIRRDQKQVNTYAVNILKVVNDKSMFHPNLMQSGAVTRRYRSRGFYGDNGMIVKGNVQNFPRGPGIRSGIIVPPGFAFVKLDLASIEARLGAHAMSLFIDFDFYCERYTKNDNFNVYLYVIENHTTHGKVSKKDNIYTAYKHGILGVQYGVGLNTFHKTMVDNFNLPYTFDECADIYNTIRHECPEFSQLQRAVSSIIQKQGHVLDDFGAIYYVPESESYKGVNYYCQGCAGNVLKAWWLELDKIMKEDYIFNVVHDEFDVAVKRGEGSRGRVRDYCHILNKLDLFELPIVAEASGLCDNWSQTG